MEAIIVCIFMFLIGGIAGGSVMLIIMNKEYEKLKANYENYISITNDQMSKLGAEAKEWMLKYYGLEKDWIDPEEE